MRYDTRVRLEFEAEGTREDLKTLLPGLGFGIFIQSILMEIKQEEIYQLY